MRRVSMVHFIGDSAKDYISALYGDTLDILMVSLGSGSATENERVIPFTLMCAITLEATFNDHLISGAFKTFPKEHYRRVASGHLSMNFWAKLDTIVPFLSRGQYIINAESDTYQSLVQLIKIRN